MSGVAAAYAVTTPFESGPEAEVAQGAAIIRAAAETDLPHLVMASVASAHSSTGIPHFESKARIEELLDEHQGQWTVLAPTYFYENVLGSTEDILAGQLPLPIPSGRRLQQLALSDLGQAAAIALAAPDRFTRSRIELAGDEPTPVEMAKALTDALVAALDGQRTTVEHVLVDLDDVRSRNPDLGAMYGFLAETGYAVDRNDLARIMPEMHWTTFSEWALEQFPPGTRP